MTEDGHTQENAPRRGNPEDVQDISTQELIDNNYETRLEPRNGPDKDPEMSRGRDLAAAMEEPGRTRHDDSINASSNNEDRSDEGYDLSTGAERSAATYVGKPRDPHYDDQLQRVNDNRDTYDGSLGQRQNQWDKKRICEAICSQLPISELQRKKILNAMEELDLERFGQQKAIERVCLGTAAVIVDPERAENADYPDEVTLLSWEDEFRATAKPLGVSMSDLSTIKRIVREELGWASLDPVTVGPKRDVNLPKIPFSDRPDEYWERQSPQSWEFIARSWETKDDEYKEAVPEEKQELVRLLHKWEPWERSDESTDRDSEEKPSNCSKIDCKEIGEVTENAFDEEFDSIDEQIAAEAAELVRLMESADS